MRPIADTPTTPPVVLQRAAAILDAFDGAHARLSLRALTDRSKLPRSTVHRLAGQLVELGWLQRGGGGYEIGFGLFELAALARHQRDLREAAMPYMDDLHRLTGELVHLAVLHGTNAVVIEKLGGHRRVTTSSRVGTQYPAHCCGIGKAMLAHAPPAVVDELIAGGLEARTPYTITVPSALRLELARVVRQGVAYDREEARLGVNCVAAPLVRRGGALLGAISVTGPTARLNPAAHAVAVKAAAAGVVASLSSRRT